MWTLDEANSDFEEIGRAIQAMVDEGDTNDEITPDRINEAAAHRQTQLDRVRLALEDIAMLAPTGVFEAASDWFMNMEEEDNGARSRAFLAAARADVGVEARSSEDTNT